MYKLLCAISIVTILVLSSSCNTGKVPISTLERQVTTIPKKIIGWEYYVELTNGNLKSETLYNVSTIHIDNTLDKAIEAIHSFTKHDSLIKRQVLKPIFRVSSSIASDISSN